MIIPDLIVAMQLRNAANVLDQIGNDSRIVAHYASELKALAHSVRDCARILEHLPPFEPDQRR